MTVDVRMEVHRPGVIDRRRRVQHVHGHRPCDWHTHRSRTLHRSVHGRRIPRLLSAEHELRQRGRFFDADAPVAEVAPPVREQTRERRPMEENVVRIREDELHGPECVRGTGALTQAKLPARNAREVRRGRRVRLGIVATFAYANDLEPLGREVRRSPPNQWQELVSGDARRDIPIRPKDYFTHRPDEHRSVVTPSCLSHDHVHGEGGLLCCAVALERMKVEGGDVDHHVPCGWLVGQPPPAFEGELDLKEYKDEYKEGLRQIIDAKIAGEEIVAPEVQESPKVVDLMEALRRSLDSVSATKKKSARADLSAVRKTKAKGMKAAPARKVAAG